VVTFPADWVQHFGVDLVTAYPPELGARFRFHERLRPQRSFAAVVELALASDPDFRAHHVGEMVRTVTGEGEYGAWVQIDGLRQGTPAERCIGAVFMDEFTSALDCIAIIPTHFAAVRQLSLDILHTAKFELSHRPRRFFYVPPSRWHGIPSGATANWYPLDFPRNLTNIVVPPARFTEETEHAATEAAHVELGAGLDLQGSSRDALTSAGGIAGAYLRVHGTRMGRTEPIYRELAMFVVGRHGYRMRLESASSDRLAEMREVLRGVAGSFKPLPGLEEAQLGRAFASASSGFAHWAS
jgi:hypothetical protein